MTIDVLKPELKEHATPRQAEYIDAVLKYGSASKAAEELGVNRRTVDRALSAAKRAAIEAGDIAVLDDLPSVLFLDIETAPCLGNFWRMFDEIGNIDAIVKDWYCLSVGYKWMGEEKPTVKSLRNYRGYRPGTENDHALLKDVHGLLSAADYVIAHNGDKFDIKSLNTRLILNGFKPPVPYKSIDTLKIARGNFNFTSNKLDYLAKVLLGKRKVRHEGLPLWQGVVAGDPKAWDTMEEYNGEDVNLLEEVYYALRAWDKMHPNMNLKTSKDNMSCSVCNSHNVKPTGDTVAVGAAGLYLGYVCGDCGHQMRGRTNIRTLSQKHSGLMNVR